MKNSNRWFSNCLGLLLLGFFCFLVSSVKANEGHDTYSFMSAQDLYDALSQQSQVGLGYLLGIIDAQKGMQLDGTCFTVPWQPDVDEIVASAFLEYWPAVADFSARAPDALIQMMQSQFPCK